MITKSLLLTQVLSTCAIHISIYERKRMAIAIALPSGSHIRWCDATSSVSFGAKICIKRAIEITHKAFQLRLLDPL